MNKSISKIEYCSLSNLEFVITKMKKEGYSYKETLTSKQEQMYNGQGYPTFLETNLQVLFILD